MAAGWDYNLTKQCASTTGTPGLPNYYSITPQCSPPSGTPTKYWQLGIQTENTLGATCISGATNGRTDLVNGTNSPIRLNWLTHNSDIGQNWAVNMKIDRSSYPPPPSCTGTVWTWFAFQDNASQGGGPLPSITSLESSHRLNFSYYLPNSASDGARLIASAVFFWGGVSHQIEIDLFSINYGYPAPTQPGLLNKVNYANGNEYIVLDGAYFGATVPANTTADTTVWIPWYQILQQAVSRGWLSTPPTGQGNSSTISVNISIETKNRAIADLYHTNFRIAGQ